MLAAARRQRAGNGPEAAGVAARHLLTYQSIPVPAFVRRCCAAGGPLPLFYFGITPLQHLEYSADMRIIDQMEGRGQYSSFPAFRHERPTGRRDPPVLRTLETWTIKIFSLDLIVAFRLHPELRLCQE